MITQCVCTHLDQDKLHGRGYRVHNETKKHTARCTVCKIEKTLSGKEVANVNKKSR